MRSATFELRPQDRRDIDGGWNLDGYKIPARERVVTRVLRLGLDQICASDFDTGRLARLAVDEASLLEVISDPTMQGFSEPEKHLVNVSIYEDLDLSRENVADAAWSPPSGILYILDLINFQVRRWSFVDRDDPELAPLALPKNLALSPTCRIAIQPRLPERPEQLDTAIFISVPDDNIIIRLSPFGQADVYAGKPGKSGRPKVGHSAISSRLSIPESMFYDSLSNRLLFANSGDASLYYVDAVGVLHRVLPEPLSFTPSSLLLYRLSDFSDIMRLEVDHRAVQENTWGALPTLLFVAAPERNSIWKATLHSSDPGLAQIEGLFVPGVDRLFLLQGGELLATQRTGGATVVRSVLQDVSPLETDVQT